RCVDDWKMLRRKRDLFVPTPEQQSAVGPTKTERVRHGVFHFSFAGLVGDVVQIAVRLGTFQVDGGRQNLIAQRQQSNSGFQPTSSAQQMSSHRLGRTYGQVVGVLAESPLDGDGFPLVADLR